MTVTIVKFNSNTDETFHGRGSGAEKVESTACLVGASRVIREGLKCTTKRPSGV